MAIAIEGKRVQGQTIFEATLIDSAVATGNGEWINAEGLKNYSIHVSGITTATVVFSGSNAATKPSDATHGIQFGSDITADGFLEYTAPVKWVKARVSAWTAGTIVVTFEGRYGG